MESQLFAVRSSLWKEKLQALQLSIRKRFRVAVDRHLHKRQQFSGNYYSSIRQRWILRFRNIYGEASQSPSVFYRKRVNEDLDAVGDSIIARMLQALAVPVIGNACYAFMHGLNNIQIYGSEKLHNALSRREQGKPLVTVSNHVASVDDPLVISALLPYNILFDAQSLRWTLCATDRCFSNPLLSAFFRCVKVLPVSRGDGVYQKGLDMAISKLNNGGWVHIFPEGSRSRDGGKTMGSAKRGVGRLVLDADNIPVVIPFVHAGMQEVMPIGSKFPKVGKTVTVLIGDPISFDDLFLTVDESKHISRETLYEAVSKRIGSRLQELKIEVDRLSLQRSLTESLDFPSLNVKHSIGLLQHVDWESLDIGSYVSEEHSPQLKQAISIRPKSRPHQQEEPKSVSTVGFSCGEGMMSRIRGYVGSNELMGFAVKGLFMNNRAASESRTPILELRPLKAWRRFFESSLHRLHRA